MYKHILNLKKKVSPVIIEKVIFKDESVASRITRTVFSIAVVFSIVWGVSKAEEIINVMLPQEEIEPTVSFSLAGLIKEVYPDKIVLTRAVGVDSEVNVFEIDIAANEQIIETNTYEKILVTDLLVGDKVIIQGLKRGDKFYSRRVISFAPRFIDTEGINGVIEPEIANEEVLEISVATTTEPLTEEIATTTDDVILDTASTTASTTEQLETGDVVTSTEPESSENIASTTEETSTTTQDASTNEAETSTTTEPVTVDETVSEPASSEEVVDGGNVTAIEIQPATEGDNSSTESTVEATSESESPSDSTSPVISE